MEAVRAAASFEGLLVLGVIYVILNLLSAAGKKRGQSTVPPPPEPDEPTATQQEALSLESILREIEKAKQEKAVERRAPEMERPLPPPPPPRRVPPPLRRAPQAPMRKAPAGGDARRGPLGRMAQRRLEGAEEVEERRSLEGESLEVDESLENLDEMRLRPPRPERDFDDEVEGIVQRRVKAAERRDRQHMAADHVDFHARIEQGEIGSTNAQELADATRRKAQMGRLRQAVVWREILGPPRSSEL